MEKGDSELLPIEQSRTGGGCSPPVPESDGVSLDVVPVSEPDGELSLQVLDGLLFDDSLEARIVIGST